MAYDTAELEKQALEAIKTHKLYFIEDVVAYLPCGKNAFYDHKLHESNELKSALLINRIETKVKLRKKWSDSDAPALQIALYKLIATQTENEAINSQKTTLNIEDVRSKVAAAFPDFPDPTDEAGKC